MRNTERKEENRETREQRQLKSERGKKSIKKKRKTWSETKRAGEAKRHNLHNRRRTTVPINRVRRCRNARIKLIGLKILGHAPLIRLFFSNSNSAQDPPTWVVISSLIMITVISTFPFFCISTLFYYLSLHRFFSFSFPLSVFYIPLLSSLERLSLAVAHMQRAHIPRTHNQRLTHISQIGTQRRIFNENSRNLRKQQIESHITTAKIQSI